MFDPETVTLIRQAPPLEGLDLVALPQLLTDAFATVVAARIRLRAGAPDPASADVGGTLALLTRLAAAQEAYVALLPDRENRAAAAFVAGSAHQARHLARVGVHEPSRITATAVGSEISSALLFLIAEAYPDAAEAAKRINPNAVDVGQIERSLLATLKMLAEGRLSDILAEPLPETSTVPSADRAVEALLVILLRGVRALAQQLSDPAAVEARVAARQLFQRAKALCIDELPDPFGDGRPAYSVFSGPLHLANLLIAAERDLGGAALSHLPAPAGADAAAWSRIVRRMARSRPFLWRNHLAAIQQGYLAHGRSAAVSFPTGAGKSTLAELKIAAALLRGDQVVFLAPTHALVAQTVRALQKTFREVSVFGDVDEEVTLSTILILPEVIVTTPERCLMLLAMQPEAFANLGLIVFDECHLLHARPDDRSRRGLDSMLCLLNLTRTAPGADLLLMSAMMKNTAEIAGWLEDLTGRECLTLDLAWKPTRQTRGCVVYDMAQLNALRDKLRAARTEKPYQKAVPAKVKRELIAQPFGFFGLRQTWSTKAREDYALRALLETREPLATSSGANWYLTPNGNQVSTAIAAGSVGAGMKTLVFVQNTIACSSCVRAFANHLTPREVIHNGITQSGVGAYLLGRLPVSLTAGESDPAEAMLKRSFAAYRRKQADEETWISSRINAALAARPAAAEEEFRWIGLVAAATGQSVDLLERVLALVDGGALEGDAGQVIASLLGWIEQMPGRLLELVRPESLEGLFGEAYKKLPTDEARALQALEMIRRILPVWMSGAPVQEIEAAIQDKATGLGYCETARHFVTRVAPDLGFVVGLPARLLLARHAATTPDDPAEVRTILATLGSIVREGCDSPESLAVRLEAGHQVSRVAARRLFNQVAPHLTPGTPTDPFETTQERVRSAMGVVMFEDLSSVPPDPPAAA
jgi:hypothetical protein